LVKKLQLVNLASEITVGVSLKCRLLAHFYAGSLELIIGLLDAITKSKWMPGRRGLVVSPPPVLRVVRSSPARVVV
jgi:hypothetical protein